MLRSEQNSPERVAYKSEWQYLAYYTNVLRSFRQRKRLPIRLEPPDENVTFSLGLLDGRTIMSLATAMSRKRRVRDTET